MLVDVTHATVSSTGDNPTIKIVLADGSSVLLATSMYNEYKHRRVVRSLDGTRLREQQKFTVTALIAPDARLLKDPK